MSEYHQTYTNGAPDPQPERANTKPRGGRGAKLGLVLVIVLLALIVLGSSAYTVKQNQYAYVTRFSKMVSVEQSPGLHFKLPFVDSVQ